MKDEAIKDRNGLKSRKYQRHWQNIQKTYTKRSSTDNATRHLNVQLWPKISTESVDVIKDDAVKVRMPASMETQRGHTAFQSIERQCQKFSNYNFISPTN